MNQKTAGLRKRLKPTKEAATQSVDDLWGSIKHAGGKLIGYRHNLDSL